MAALARVWLIAVVAGCGRVGFELRDDADADADMDVDVDGDGLVGVADNCPAIANVDQANEDGDRFGDACDPCPPYADVDPVDDLDGDGVSAACDPNPSVPGDQIALFEGFNSGAPAGATVIGPWVFAGGVASVVSGVASRNVISWPVPGTGSETIMGYGTIDALVGGGTQRAFGVTDQLDVSPDVGVGCEYQDTPSDVMRFEVIEIGPATVIDYDLTAIPVGIGVGFRLTRAGAMYSCQSGAGRVLSGSSSLTGPSIGIRARSMSGSFNWALLVQSP